MAIDRLQALLVISSQSLYLSKIHAWINELDRAGGGDGRQLYVYSVKNARALDLAALLNQVFTGAAGVSSDINAESGVAPRLEELELGKDKISQFDQQKMNNSSAEFKIIANESSNSLLLLAYPHKYKLIERDLDRLDVMPLQVMIEATIAEVTLNDDLKYGLQWLFSNGNSSFVFSSLSNGNVSSSFPGFSYSLAGASANVVLNALSQITNVNVISSPQLMVLDNQTARLQVGDQVPVATQSAVSTGNDSSRIVNSIEFKDTGVILNVTPRVTAAGTVVLNVSQEVSDVVSTTTSDIDSPTIQQRQISSTIAVRGGETVALGGLIKSKDYDAGGRPHAVATARGGQTFSYDDNGNVLFDGERNYAWTSFNKPSLVTRLTASTITHTSFVYGPDRSRIRQSIFENNIRKEVVYVGDYYERRAVVDAQGSITGLDQDLNYIRVDGVTIAIHKIDKRTDGTRTEETLWYSLDHIGSVVLTTDASGNVSEAMSYDAHGARREASWEAALLPVRPVDTPRGFTGHEHLDAVGIIHMNGRIYDPELGRMLSPDPNVPDPTVTQEFNRYAYVRNNPLSYTDPTGFALWGGDGPGRGHIAEGGYGYSDYNGDGHDDRSSEQHHADRVKYGFEKEVKNTLAVPGQNPSFSIIRTQALAGAYEYSLGSLVDLINTPINAVLGLTSTNFRFGLTQDLLDYVEVGPPISLAACRI
jgi:RHS repeat-associated protein